MGIDMTCKNSFQVLLPMGGLGQRFRDEGYNIPKPLLKIDNRHMFEYILDSIQNHDINFDLVAVIRAEHELEYNFKQVILQKYPTSTVLIIDKNTRGPVETALFAETAINSDKPLFVVDCDIAFKSEGFAILANELAFQKTSGALISFISEDPRYSYAKVNSENEVVETAEKTVISENALMGVYGFKSGSYFVQLAKELIEKGLSAQRPEFYMSDLYSEMISQGNKVKITSGDFFCFGTPEELRNYENTRLPISKVKSTTQP